MDCIAIPKQPPSLSSSLSTIRSPSSYTTSSSSNNNNKNHFDSRSYQTKMWRGYGFGSSAASSPSPPASFPQPAPPPPSPCDGLLDIYPRKTSFSTISGSNTYCAFPSWPNRSSLSSGSEDEGSNSASAYLSDEDLFPVSSSSSTNPSSFMMTESPFGSGSYEDETRAVIGAPGLTTEEQIRHINETEDWRMRNYVQAQAQARALQALRAAQLVAVEASKQQRKRRAGPKKRRSHGSTAATSGSGAVSPVPSTSASASAASSASSKPV